jgi:hypothetical protein
MADKFELTHLEYGDEKNQSHFESPHQASSDESPAATEYVTDPVEARRIVRKIDYRVIPLLSLLYL